MVLLVNCTGFCMRVGLKVYGKEVQNMSITCDTKSLRATCREEMHVANVLQWIFFLADRP